jgi:hypothetical protein
MSRIGKHTAPAAIKSGRSHGGLLPPIVPPQLLHGAGNNAPNSVVVNSALDTQSGKSMLQGYIVDPETGKVVAVIRNDEIFRDGKEGAKIATVLNGNLYDLTGSFVGRLDGPHAIDVRAWSMPVAVMNFLERQTGHQPILASKQRGGPRSPSPAQLERSPRRGYDGVRGSTPDRSHNDPAH